MTRKDYIAGLEEIRTVPSDRFHTVYNALRDLVSRLEQEGLK